MATLEKGQDSIKRSQGDQGAGANYGATMNNGNLGSENLKQSQNKASTPNSSSANSSSSFSSGSGVNQSSGPSKIRERLQDVSDRLNINSLNSEDTRRVIDDASERVSDLYSNASQWLELGNNKMVGMVAVAAAVGVIGFFLGRASVSSDQY